MDLELRRLVSLLKSRLETSEPEVRLEILAKLKEGFCSECGFDFGKTGVCHCWNDE